jgi:uncharacterized protein YbbK (DUF523 family)
MNNDKPRVGVSRCLLGDAVRYDGGTKTNRIVVQKLNRLFNLIAVCPEVEAGLPVPRPPVQLTGNISHPELIGRDNPAINITGIMQNYCSDKAAGLEYLDGFIFKSRSPSCGLNSTPVFQNDIRISDSGRGIFAKTLCEAYPELPVIEDIELDNTGMLEKFIHSVLSKHKDSD